MKSPDRITAALATIPTAAAMACGGAEPNRVIELCENPQPAVTCVAAYSDADPNFQIVEATFNVGSLVSEDPKRNGLSCFDDRAGKEVRAVAQEVNEMVVDETGGGATLPNMPDGRFRDDALQRRLTNNELVAFRIPRNGGDGWAVGVEVSDIEVTQACNKAAQARAQGSEDFEAEDTCEYDPSIQNDIRTYYSASVTGADSLATCRTPDQATAQTQQALRTRAGLGTILPKRNFQPAQRYRKNR